jgi:hypothetical protein
VTEAITPVQIFVRLLTADQISLEEGEEILCYMITRLTMTEKYKFNLKLDFPDLFTDGTQARDFSSPSPRPAQARKPAKPGPLRGGLAGFRPSPGHHYPLSNLSDVCVICEPWRRLQHIFITANGVFRSLLMGSSSNH